MCLRGYSQSLSVPRDVPGNALEPQVVAVHGGAAAGAQSWARGGTVGKQGATQEQCPLPCPTASHGHD